MKNSLILEQKNQSYEFVNADETLNSVGFETNLKLKYKDFTLFTNYAFNDVKLDKNQKSLTPKHSFGGVLMYEVENNWRIGYEAYYKGSQLRNNGAKTPSFWTMGFMVMKTIDKITLYVNLRISQTQNNRTINLCLRVRITILGLRIFGHQQMDSY